MLSEFGSSKKIIIKTPLLACLPAGRPGGEHPDRCGKAAERLDAGW